MPPPSAYDRRFVGEFLSQLQERNWPQYPQAPWWTALRRADEIQPCQSPSPLLITDRLSNDTRTCTRSGVPDPSQHDGTKKWCAQIDQATRRFWQQRYGT